MPRDAHPSRSTGPSVRRIGTSTSLWWMASLLACNAGVDADPCARQGSGHDPDGLVADAVASFEAARGQAVCIGHIELFDEPIAIETGFADGRWLPKHRTMQVVTDNPPGRVEEIVHHELCHMIDIDAGRPSDDHPDWFTGDYLIGNDTYATAARRRHEAFADLCHLLPSEGSEATKAIEVCYDAPVDWSTEEGPVEPAARRWLHDTFFDPGPELGALSLEPAFDGIADYRVASVVSFGDRFVALPDWGEPPGALTTWSANGIAGSITLPPLGPHVGFSAVDGPVPTLIVHGDGSDLAFQRIGDAWVEADPPEGTWDPWLEQYAEYDSPTPLGPAQLDEFGKLAIGDTLSWRLPPNALRWVFTDQFGVSRVSKGDFWALVGVTLDPTQPLAVHVPCDAPARVAVLRLDGSLWLARVPVPATERVSIDRIAMP